MKKYGVIIVDDAAFIRSILKNIIEKNEMFKVIAEGEDGNEAIMLAQNLNPDIIIIDINMPRINGLYVVKEILKVSDKIKVIVCSALGQQPMVIDAIKLGAKDYLIKPFIEERVIRALKNSIHSK